MNKKDVVEHVKDAMDSTRADAERLVDSVLDAIVSSLKRGDEVAIAGFGKFVVRDRAARTARNPQTGETVEVPATRVPKFSAAKALKDAVK